MKTPQHLAIIMDGNRRWAQKKSVKPQDGHRQGTEALEEIVTRASELGIKYLTVYALSTENLKSRKKIELAGLFSLVREMLVAKLPKLKKEQVRIEFFGDLEKLPLAVRKAAQLTRDSLAGNKGLQLNIALNYGSREEIVQAAAKFPKTGEEEDFNSLLYTSSLPDPELIIRTGGEKRLSNFLLWQAAYSELYFTDTLWPDFDEKEFDKALEDFTKRKRNFGS